MMCAPSRWTMAVASAMVMAGTGQDAAAAKEAESQGVPTPARIWYVAPGGAEANAGTRTAPWDLASAVRNPRVKAGHAVHLLEGVYKLGGRQIPIELRGRAGRPIAVRGAPGQHAVVEGGFTFGKEATSAHVWLMDMELKGCHSDGVDLYGGSDCKLINLVLHDNRQGIGAWVGALNTEIYGCLIYDNGYPPQKAGDRWHGHCIYSQNRSGQGTKVISNCIMSTKGDGQFTVHLYTQGGFVDNYLVTENICYDGYGFLIGGIKTGRDLRMVRNYLYDIQHVWFGNPWIAEIKASNVNGEMRDNVIVNPYWGAMVYRFEKLAAIGNLVVNKPNQELKASLVVHKPDGARDVRPPMPRPTGVKAVLLPNKYDPDRAHLAVFNWDKAPKVTTSFAGFLNAGQSFRLMNPKDFYGKPVFAGKASPTGTAAVPMKGEFAAYVVWKGKR